MILGGFWHGASWTFIIWGVYHGVLLSINHLYRGHFKKEKPVVISIHHKTTVLYKSKRLLKILFTFIIVALGWVLFRCANFSHALNIYKSLFGFSANVTNKISLSFEHGAQWQILLLSILIVFFVPDTLVLREKFFAAVEVGKQKGVVRAAIACALMAVMSILCFSRVQYFLYSGF
jgi:D-alanyl-lipoteichoic acid acyltransferase DltB (MBOAT superfamily)